MEAPQRCKGWQKSIHPRHQQRQISFLSAAVCNRSQTADKVTRLRFKTGLERRSAAASPPKTSYRFGILLLVSRLYPTLLDNSACSFSVLGWLRHDGVMSFGPTHPAEPHARVGRGVRTNRQRSAHKTATRRQPRSLKTRGLSA